MIHYNLYCNPIFGLPSRNICGHFTWGQIEKVTTDIGQDTQGHRHRQGNSPGAEWRAVTSEKSQRTDKQTQTGYFTWCYIVSHRQMARANGWYLIKESIKKLVPNTRLHQPVDKKILFRHWISRLTLSYLTARVATTILWRKIYRSSEI